MDDFSVTFTLGLKPRPLNAVYTTTDPVWEGLRLSFLVLQPTMNLSSDKGSPVSGGSHSSLPILPLATFCLRSGNHLPGTAPPWS